MSNRSGLPAGGALAAAAMLAILWGGASAANPSGLAERLDPLLGDAQAGMNVAVAPGGASLPSPADRGDATAPAADLSAVEVRISAALPEGDGEWRCLAEAIYHEARGESLPGQIAVAEVVLNRRDSGRYPATVCGVVEQGSGERNMCQFSFYCDGLSDAVADDRSWVTAGRIARAMLDGAPRLLTDGAMFYHARAVEPYWADNFTRTATIGAHLFYREDVPVRLASSVSN